MPIKKLPAMVSLAKKGPKWKRTGLRPGAKTAVKVGAIAGVGAGLGAGTAGAIAPKGHRKKAAGYGGLWGSVFGVPGGIGVGLYHRGKKRGRKK